MADETTTDAPDAEVIHPRCLQCDRMLSEGEDREQTQGGVFCRTCFETLRGQVHQVVQQQSADIPWGAAAIGGALGGVLGAIVWWGFTVVTNIVFGLVAIVIGFLVGKGIAMFTGGKRSLGLQVMAVSITLVSYFYASFLVNRTFILQAFAGQGVEVSFFPDPELFYNVIAARFRFFDLIFIAIALWQAWKMPAPIRLGA